MKRILCVAAIALLCLTACAPGEVDRPLPARPPSQWYQITDPTNDLTFRCHQVLNHDGHGSDIYTEWCYGPVKVKTTFLPSTTVTDVEIVKP